MAFKLPKFGKNKNSELIEEQQALKSIDFIYDTTLESYDGANEISPKPVVKNYSRAEVKKRKELSEKLSADVNESQIPELLKQREKFDLEIPGSQKKVDNATKLSKTISAIFGISRSESKAVSDEIARIQKFMLQVRDSNDIKAFIDFAEESSGSESAITFMESLYYYTQSTGDTQVIEELSKLSSKEMFAQIDQIIRYKMGKVSKIPLLLVATVMIPLFGILGAFAVSIFSTIMGAFTGF